MCDDAFSWWFRLLLNVTSGAMFGWAYGKLRRARRELRDVQTMRAVVSNHLRWSECLLSEVKALSSHDDNPPVPPSLH